MAQYSSRCPVCNGIQDRSFPNLADGGDPFDEIISAIAARLYNEKITKGFIDQALYEKTADDLLKAIHQGLGGSSFSIDDSRNMLKAYLEQNIYQFSAAKSITELEHFRSLMTGADGKLLSFTEFRNAVLDAGYNFNVNWLRTEYNTTVAAAQSARQWQQFIDNGTETLQYSTVGDDRVRPAHAELDGFTASISDPVWNLIYPPNDWNCRCWVIPGLDENIGSQEVDEELFKENTPYLFQRNVGTTKVIYDEDHTYYKAGASRPKELLAEKNYGMPSVEALYNKFRFEPKIEFGSKEEANKWWADQAGSSKGKFVVSDVTGVNVKLDNEFRVHIAEDNNENRWAFISNVKDILQHPDEVWSLRNGGELDRYYLKYFAKYPIMVKVNVDDGVRAYTMVEFERKGKLNLDGVKRIRRGVLIYRKK